MPDTRITPFLRDIAPFFKGQKITYVDVGAYVGHIYEELMQSAIVISEAHLIEPNPDSYETLQDNIKTWQTSFPNIHDYHVAVGERQETLVFEKNRTMTRVVSSNTTDTHSQIDGTHGTSPDTDERHFSIDSVKLDTLAKKAITCPIDLMKIDVEGHEIPALRGARQLLKNQQVHVIYIEAGIDPENTQQTHVHKLDNFLRRYGYRPYRIYEQKHEWQKRSPLLRRINVAYMSEEFAQAHPVEDN